MYHTTDRLWLSFHNTFKSVKLAQNSDLVSVFEFRSDIGSHCCKYEDNYHEVKR